MSALADTLVHEITAVRTAIKDPVVFVCGDFNHRDLSGELAFAGDLRQLGVRPTRGTNELNMLYTNKCMAVTDTRILPPLERITEVLKPFNKTDSMVAGEPRPHPIRNFAAEFAVPVMRMYNIRQGGGPASGKLITSLLLG